MKNKINLFVFIIISFSFQTKKALIMLLSLITISCSYYNDQLTIINKLENKNICYSTYLISKDTKIFYEASAGGEFSTLNFKNSPIVRIPIIDLMKDNSLDKSLYIVIYKKQEQGFVFKNSNNVPNNKKFKTYKYTLKELEHLKWTIVIK